MTAFFFFFPRRRLVVDAFADRVATTGEASGDPSAEESEKKGDEEEDAPVDGDAVDDPLTRRTFRGLRTARSRSGDTSGAASRVWRTLSDTRVMLSWPSEMTDRNRDDRADDDGGSAPARRSLRATLDDDLPRT